MNLLRKVSAIAPMAIVLCAGMWLVPQTARAACGALPYPNFNNGTSLVDANTTNANNAALLSCSTNVDNTQIGTAGVYASQIIPLTIAQATFGGTVPYTFANGIGALILNYTGACASTAVCLANDAAATNGLTFNVPSGSTNGYRFQVGGTTVASIPASGAALFPNGTAAGSSAYGPTSASIAGPLSATSASFTSTLKTTYATTGVTNGIYCNGCDLTSARSANVGYYYFGSGGSDYLDSDGTNYNLVGNGSGDFYVGPATIALGYGSSYTSSTLCITVCSGGNGFTFTGTASGNGTYISAPGTNMAFGISASTVAGIACSNFGWATLGSSWKACADTSGDLGVAASFYSASSRALKNNIAPLAQSRADFDVDHTTIDVFCYKSERCKPNETDQVGVIAEETPADIAGPKHNHLSLNALLSIDTLEIKELRREVAALASDVKDPKILEAAQKPWWQLW